MVWNVQKKISWKNVRMCVCVSARARACPYKDMYDMYIRNQKFDKIRISSGTSRYKSEKINHNKQKCQKHLFCIIIMPDCY